MHPQWGLSAIETAGSPITLLSFSRAGCSIHLTLQKMVSVGANHCKRGPIIVLCAVVSVPVIVISPFASISLRNFALAPLTSHQLSMSLYVKSVAMSANSSVDSRRVDSARYRTLWTPLSFSAELTPSAFATSRAVFPAEPKTSWLYFANWRKSQVAGVPWL